MLCLAAFLSCSAAVSVTSTAASPDRGDGNVDPLVLLGLIGPDIFV